MGFCLRRFIAGLELNFYPLRSVEGEHARFGNPPKACDKVRKDYRKPFEELDPPHPQRDYCGQLAALGKASIGLWTVLASTTKDCADGHEAITTTNSTANGVKKLCAERKVRRLILGEGPKCANVFAKFNESWLTSGELKLADDETTRKCFKQRKYAIMREGYNADAIELAVCDSPQAAAKKMKARESYRRLCFSPMNV